MVTEALCYVHTVLIGDMKKVLIIPNMAILNGGSIALMVLVDVVVEEAEDSRPTNTPNVAAVFGGDPSSSINAPVSYDSLPRITSA